MTMSPRLRKLALAIHLTTSVGWIGAVLVYLVLVVAGMTTPDDQFLRATWITLESIGSLALVPMSIVSLLTGLLMSLGTKWGLFRHYWVLLSLVLTAVASGILIQHMQTVTFYAGVAADVSSNNIAALQSALDGELLHSGLGLLVLLVIQVLNVYKPRGMTPYGWRRQQQQYAQKAT